MVGQASGIYFYYYYFSGVPRAHRSAISESG